MLPGGRHAFFRGPKHQIFRKKREHFFFYALGNGAGVRSRILFKRMRDVVFVQHGVKLLGAERNMREIILVADIECDRM